MKKIMKLLVTLLISFVILSCQGRSIQTTSQSISTPTTLMPSLASPEMATSTVAPPTTVMPDVLTDKANFISGLSGSLYIGPSQKGTYYEFAFDSGEVFKRQLPENCRLLSTSQNAICDTMLDGSNKGLYVYNILTGKHDFLTEQYISKWGVSGDGNLLLYLSYESENDSGVSVFIYNFETKTRQEVGIMYSNDELAIPWITSVSGNFLIGMNQIKEELMIAETRPGEEKKALIFKPINIAQNFAASEFHEWSPNQALIVLLGYDRNDEPVDFSAYQCTWIAAVYDPYEQNVVATMKAPEGQCFEKVMDSRPAVWSPDNSRFVLSLGQDMCIVDVANFEQGCTPISIHHEEDYGIQSLSWSPDSNYLAYHLVEKMGRRAGELWVYSVKEDKNYLITTDEGFHPSFYGLYLLWGQ